MKAMIQKIGYDHDIDIVELEIPGDHIHMVVRSVPKQSPSKVMQVIKSISARQFFKRYPASLHSTIAVFLPFRKKPACILFLGLFGKT